MGRKLSAYNLHMKRELKGKLSGKTKAQRKAIFKAAARKWKSKGKRKPASRSKPKSGGSKRKPVKSSSKTGGRRMGKNSFSTQKIFALVRKGALAAPAIGVALDPSLTPQEKARVGFQKYTGVDMRTGKFHFNSLREGYEPYFWTSLATHGIPKVISFVKGLLS